MKIIQCKLQVYHFFNLEIIDIQGFWVYRPLELDIRNVQDLLSLAHLKLACYLLGKTCQIHSNLTELFIFYLQNPQRLVIIIIEI